MNPTSQRFDVAWHGVWRLVLLSLLLLLSSAHAATGSGLLACM